MLKVGDRDQAAGAIIVAQPSSAAIVLALGTVYIVWGSTYLAMREALTALPPFVMAGTRFVIAGVLALAWAQWQDGTRLQWREVIDAIITGAVLLVGGNGSVVWALQTVPGGMAALIVAIVPLWVAILEWLRPHGARPDTATLISLLLGLAGVAWLLAPKAEAESGVPLAGGLALVFSSICWGIGSVYIRARSEKARTPFFRAIALQMIAGGTMLYLISLVRGDFALIDVSRFSVKSLGAMVYLVVAGSLISYTAYGWLLTVARPTLVATYAFVNPVVAVLLGYALADETPSLESLLAGGLVVISVALMVLGRQVKKANHAERKN